MLIGRPVSEPQAHRLVGEIVCITPPPPEMQSANTQQGQFLGAIVAVSNACGNALIGTSFALEPSVRSNSRLSAFGTRFLHFRNLACMREGGCCTYTQGRNISMIKGP